MFETRWEPGDETAVGYRLDPDDVDGILRSIRLGKQHSDLLVAAIHTHDEGPDIATPPAYLVELAHQAIDSGADVFVAHGIHRLLPIEIYDGKPILYGLGNFLFSDIAEPVQGALYADYRNKWKPVFGDLLPTDAELNLIMNAGDFAGERYFESIVAVFEFTEGRAQVRLQPFDLGYGLPLTRSGLPRKPEPARAETILRNLAEMSQPFGTTITLEDGHGLAL
jgi:poly-gamma-glutamate synthesis protein (capsule biosynthesis protein)